MKKLVKFTHVKSVDIENRLVRAYVSDFGWDRDQERFAKGAWLLDNFKKNPVVLFAHASYNWPIGKCIEIIEDEIGLLTVTQFADTEEGEKCLKLFADGILNAFSVGFIPREIAYEDIEKDRRGRVFVRAELLEYSVVPVPANPGACVTHDQAELVRKTCGEGYVRQDGEKFLLTDGPAPGGVIEPKPAESGTAKGTGETPAAAAEPKDPDIEMVLKEVISLAKTVKFKPTGDNRLNLVKSAINVFQDIVTECEKEEVTREEFDQLKALVGEFAGCVRKLYPSKEELVKTVLSQLDKALKSPDQE